MFVTDYLCSIDAMRLAQACTYVGQAYTSSVPVLAPFAPVAILVAVTAMVLLLSKHSTIAVATPFYSTGKWLQTTRWGKKLEKRKEGKTMRADMEKELDDALVEEIVDIIESKRSAGLITDAIASEKYARLGRRIFPVLRYAVDGPAETLKDRIKARMKNEDRDTSGKIIPLPLPKEVSTRKHRALVVRSSS